jgi:hypothetical protein
MTQTMYAHVNKRIIIIKKTEGSVKFKKINKDTNKLVTNGKILCSHSNLFSL